MELGHQKVTPEYRRGREIPMPIAHYWGEHFKQREQRGLPEAGAGLGCPSKVPGAVWQSRVRAGKGHGTSVLRTGR